MYLHVYVHCSEHNWISLFPREFLLYRHMNIYTNVSAYLGHTYTYMYMYINILTYIHTHIDKYEICVYIYVYICTYTFVYTYICKYIYIISYILYTYIHMCIHMSRQVYRKWQVSGARAIRVAPICINIYSNV